MTDEFIRVPVEGGELGVHVWGDRSADTPVVLAAHGITANGLSWAGVAGQLAGEATLVAPDLRGRASSAGVAEPYGLHAHADDLRAVLDHLGARTALLTGHSMGAYVAAVAARRYPERFTGAVLVDGGVAFAAPAADDIDAALNAVLGPAMKRFEMTFADAEAYREYWRAHPALGDTWPRWMDDYLIGDLLGTEPELRSSCVRDAIRADGADVLANTEIHEAVHNLRSPSVLLWAPAGLLGEPPGLYNDTTLSLQDLAIETVEVPGTNHYTIVLSDSGAAVVADHIRAALRHETRATPAR